MRIHNPLAFATGGLADRAFTLCEMHPEHAASLNYDFIGSIDAPDFLPGGYSIGAPDGASANSLTYREF